MKPDKNLNPAHENRTITRINAPPKIEVKLQVAAYCRVSTARDGQLASLEAQKEHYEKLIREHKDWEFTDIYYEEGITGTKKEIRPELQRMISDCKKGKIDLILTKSISRFARNTSDCLSMVRTLTSIGTNIFFEKENIHTGAMGSEFLLTILASIAEEESRSISGNEEWAIRKRFKEGTFKPSKAPYGYRVQDGVFSVVPEEAEIVREIFEDVLDGKGTVLIAKELNSRQVPTGTKSRDGSDSIWTADRIRGMVKNVTYIGDLLMQKTWVDENFHRYRNFGDKPQYYYEGHHEAIIRRETFEAAQEAIIQRGREKGNFLEEGEDERNRKYQRRSCFSGKLFCGSCGSPMKRVTQQTASGKRLHWVCTQHLRDPSACPQKRVPEQAVRTTFITMLNKLNYFGDLILEPYIEEISLAEKQRYKKQENDILDRLKENVEKREELALLLQDRNILPIIYKKELFELEMEAASLREELRSLGESTSLSEGAKTFSNYIKKRAGSDMKGDFPEDAFSKYVTRVNIYDRRRFEYLLQCGLIFCETIRNEA